jgi:hypothetical protein
VAQAALGVGDDGLLWTECFDPASQKCYYYHRLTKQTSWTQPPSYVMQVGRRAVGEREKERERGELCRTVPPLTAL